MRAGASWILIHHQAQVGFGQSLVDARVEGSEMTATDHRHRDGAQAVPPF
jgi:hypothetical protein